jgi:ABC-type polysaccharide/polyol phosphate export permease
MEGDSDTWSDWRKFATLVKHLARRNLAARYRGSALGFFWSLMNPIIMMCVYTFVFQFVLRLSAPGVPFPVFFLTGVLAWNFIQVAILNAGTSIVDNHGLIDKAYFPRIALPISFALSSGFNYVVTIPILIIFNLLFGIAPNASILLLPLALLYLFVVALGLGLIAASLAPFFRDLIQMLELLLLAWFFATPVLYPISMAQNLPGPVFTAYQLNPMLGAVLLTRTAFFGEQVAASSILISAASTVVLLLVGLGLFYRLQSRFSTTA